MIAVGAILLCIAATCLTRVAIVYLIANASRLSLLRTNFQGRSIVTGMGLALAVPATVVYAAAVFLLPGTGGLYTAFLLVTVGSAALGFLDDRFGSRAVGGFRGHFGELRRGKITTGAAKALLLPPGVVFIALIVFKQPLLPALLTGVVVSLCANTLNLLDVRPGRTVMAWLAVGVLLLILAPGDRCPLLLLFGPVALYLPVDASRKGMLGDVGSNFLGAVLGLEIATATPAAVQALVALLLMYVQFLSERQSLSEVIQSKPWLRWLDAPGQWGW